MKRNTKQEDHLGDEDLKSNSEKIVNSKVEAAKAAGLLMIPAELGALEIVKYLCEGDAQIGLADTDGIQGDTADSKGVTSAKAKKP